MSTYRRAYQDGGCYFFTVVTYDRAKILTLPNNLDRLRLSFRHVMEKLPFVMDAVVILPDHLHCIWQLPPDDSDFSTRWRLIKRHFAVGIDAPLTSRGEKKVWQRRFWEHLLRDEEDWRRHMDYIHYNPVKHGYVSCPADWVSGSFQRAVKQGLYPANWGGQEPPSVAGMGIE